MNENVEFLLLSATERSTSLVIRSSEINICICVKTAFKSFSIQYYCKRNLPCINGPSTKYGIPNTRRGWFPQKIKPGGGAISGEIVISSFEIFVATETKYICHIRWSSYY